MHHEHDSRIRLPRLQVTGRGWDAQVWQGALLLADYILEQGEACAGCIALEVGAGTGLAGIVLARVAARVFLTDIERCVLDNCQACLACNLHAFSMTSV